MRRLWTQILGEIGLLISCGCSKGPEELPPLVWHTPLKTGDEFELIRVERALVNAEALGVRDGVLPKFGWHRRLVFHGCVTAANEGELAAELTVHEARVDSFWGDERARTEYARGQTDAQMTRAQNEEVDEDWTRTYRIKMNRAGMMVHWEGRLGATDLLHGLGGEHYNALTGLLVSVRAL